MRIGESLSEGSSANAESSEGLNERRLKRWWSLRRGNKSSLATRDLRAEGGMLAMSQGLLEARVAKVLAGIACTNFNNLCLRYFSCRRFEMIGSADVGREGKS